MIASTDAIYADLRDNRAIEHCMMETNKEFAVLVGRAFLREIEAGHTESAVAFGRAFLLSLGMKGPEEKEVAHFSNGKDFGEHLVLAHD